MKNTKSDDNEGLLGGDEFQDNQTKAKKAVKIIPNMPKLKAGQVAKLATLEDEKVPLAPTFP